MRGQPDPGRARDIIKARRKELLWDQRALATAAGVSVRTIGRLESPISPEVPSLPLLIALVRALRMDRGEMLTLIELYTGALPPVIAPPLPGRYEPPRPPT